MIFLVSSWGGFYVVGFACLNFGLMLRVLCACDMLVVYGWCDNGLLCSLGK